MTYHGARRVLVAGGAGFLGSHLCDRLIADGSDVLCVDNSTGEVMPVQDADFDDDPGDYPRLLAAIEDGMGKVVYGSRFMNGVPQGMRRESAHANKLLTMMTNVLFRGRLTDID